MFNQCIGCGCTEDKACINESEPCHWLKLDKALGLGVCSSCPDKIEALEAHQAQMVKFFAEDNETAAASG